ncbi:zinc-ribbon domain-containing protein [Candidatus Pelagibacter sp.]|uniref:zinc-ribbon domain-containing protein n=1 Tax=Candidatus Pelagibacter sp. TaxID=2024849 RepID=UPI003F87D0BD
MIITCENCNKSFDVDSALIPENGRLLQCSACDHKWFYKISKFLDLKLSDNQTTEEITENLTNDNEEVEVQNKKNQKNFGGIFFKIFGYFIVILITVIAIIIILDTFKSPLSRIFPNLELFLFNLIETLKDIKFFIKDLIS